MRRWRDDGILSEAVEVRRSARSLANSSSRQAARADGLQDFPCDFEGRCPGAMHCDSARGVRRGRDSRGTDAPHQGTAATDEAHGVGPLEKPEAALLTRERP
ncbi:MAG: hypothetical protein AMXMBFR34_46000 [Myxococcaceae bacterium]